MPTSDEQTRLETTATFYDAILNGHWDRVDQCVSQNLTVREADGLPFGGSYRGLSGLKSLFETLTGYWEDLRIEKKAITVGDGCCVGIVRLDGRAKATGRHISMPIVEILEFEGDRISSITPFYWDTKLLAEAIEARPGS